jgi:hypothetical protein
VDQFMLLSLIMVEGNVCVFLSVSFFCLYYKNYDILSNLSNKSNVIILTFFSLRYYGRRYRCQEI